MSTTPSPAGAPDAATAPSRREVRAAAKRRRARRDVLVAVVATIVVLGGLAAVLLTSPGWPNVRETFFDTDQFSKHFPDVLGGFWLDVKLFVIIELGVLVLGLLIAVLRSTRAPVLFPLRLVATVFTDVLRGIPTILLVYLFGFGLPALELTGVPTDPLVCGAIALTLSYSAYVAEVFRSGIDSIHPAQRSAALALGLSESQALRHVVLPQAVRRVVPPLLNDFIALQKDVAIVGILGPQEAFRIAQISAAEQFNYTPLIAAALLYLCVTIPLARLVDYMQHRSRVRQNAGAPA
ncbi:amino acid ABC transporter permease [Patulibacter sp. SYSU D01012]|uniref:amino acid ABC transporter permease n=1 Tax=Patulibacter sp. SYSU D01012 TaxID=2817381 RepID=UPI001B3140CC|nr:amino acid ABC transporter permease [Patulibacter sp. SYSU D01012]